MSEEIKKLHLYVKKHTKQSGRVITLFRQVLAKPGIEPKEYLRNGTKKRKDGFDFWTLIMKNATWEEIALMKKEYR